MMGKRLRDFGLGVGLLAGVWANGAQALDILLSNDDGFAAPGLIEMRKALLDADHRVVVVAPRLDQSGTSAKVTTTQMALTEESPGVWVVDGSPADAVWVGLHRVFAKAAPDLVISGSNRGQNLGAVTNLSGTVGAAVMAAMNDVPAIAVSVGLNFEEGAQGFPSTLAAYPAAAGFTAGLVARLAQATPKGRLLPAGTVLNVNYPALATGAVKGARWTSLGAELGYSHEFKDGDVPGTVKLAFGPDRAVYPDGARTDTARFAAGYITVTLLDIDRLAPRPARLDVVRRLGELVQP